MKNKYIYALVEPYFPQDIVHSFYLLKFFVFFLFFYVFQVTLLQAQHSSHQPMPDTLGGSQGWRYAKASDTAYWPQVNAGDLLIFQGSYPDRIDSRSYKEKIHVGVGNKIFIWRGRYERILLENAKNLSIESTFDHPCIITNLGGQVRWGESYKNDHYRSFSVAGIDHVFVSGEYDVGLGTGHPYYLGLKGDLTKKEWHKNFGLLGDQKYTSYRFDKSHTNGLRILNFKSVRIRGVSVIRGYFAGFNIKNDKGDTTPTYIDIQHCLSGWHESEGFYIGYNASISADGLSDNVVIFKNNVTLFTGGEALQADFLNSGTRIQNNFFYKSACFYQTPFQGFHNQEHGFQWSHVNSDIRVENNIFYTGNAGSILNGPRFKPKEGTYIRPGKVVLKNNLLGPSRRSIGYIFPGDSLGLISYHFVDNVIDSITFPPTNDAYITEKLAPDVGFFNCANYSDSIYLINNIYPFGRKLITYVVGNGRKFLEVGSAQKKAPPLRLHENFGFNAEDILTFKGVWLTGEYNKQVTSTGPIPYKKGDIVFTLDNEKTTYYQCILDHDQVRAPKSESSYWKKLTWDGKDEPAYTPLLQPDSYYAQRGMGLTIQPEKEIITHMQYPEIGRDDPTPRKPENGTIVVNKSTGVEKKQKNKVEKSMKIPGTSNSAALSSVSADKTYQIHLSHEQSRVEIVNNPGNFWNQLIISNSTGNYSMTNLVPVNGQRENNKMMVSVKKSPSEGFDYSNGLNTGAITNNDSGVLPDAILNDFVCTSKVANVVVSGLQSSDKYTIQTLSNSRSIWNGRNMSVSITIGNTTQKQNFSPQGGNTSKLLTWNAISPDSSGKINIQVEGEDTYGPLNAIIISKE